MSATYGHQIIGTEAHSSERFGTRIASQRPRQRIEEDGTATGHMIAFAIGAAVAMALIAWGL